MAWASGGFPTDSGHFGLNNVGRRIIERSVSKMSRNPLRRPYRDDHTEHVCCSVMMCDEMVVDAMGQGSLAAMQRECTMRAASWRVNAQDATKMRRYLPMPLEMSDVYVVGYAISVKADAVLRPPGAICDSVYLVANLFCSRLAPCPQERIAARSLLHSQM